MQADIHRAAEAAGRNPHDIGTEAGVAVVPIDHGVTRSLYFRDPDGNQLEVYVDVSDAWKKDPALLARNRPLAL